MNGLTPADVYPGDRFIDSANREVREVDSVTDWTVVDTQGSIHCLEFEIGAVYQPHERIPEDELLAFDIPLEQGEPLEEAA